MTETTISRGKFVCETVTTTRGQQEIIKFSAVCKDTDEVIPEDLLYHKYTPYGVIEIHVSNPALAGKFKPGDKFYVDFKQLTKG